MRFTTTLRLLIVGVLVSTLLFLALPTTSAQQVAVPVVVAADGAHLREAPNLGATIIAVFPRGSMLSATARDLSGAWLLVTTPGFIGWMYTGVVEADLNALTLLPIEIGTGGGGGIIVQQAPQIIMPPQQAPQVAAPAQQVIYYPVYLLTTDQLPLATPLLRTVMTTTAELRLRANPSTESPILTVIPANTPVVVQRATTDLQWAQVTYWMHTGYVSTRYLQ